MSKIVVHGGDFRPGSDHSFSLGALHLHPIDSPQFSPATRIPLSNLASVELASEESVKKFWGAVGLAAVAGTGLGVFTLGLGLLGAGAGNLAGRNKKQIRFLATLTYDRAFMATTDLSPYKKIAGAALTNWTRSSSRPAPSASLLSTPIVKSEQVLCIKCGKWAASQECECGRVKPLDAPRRSI